MLIDGEGNYGGVVLSRPAPAPGRPWRGAFQVDRIDQTAAGAVLRASSITSARWCRLPGEYGSPCEDLMTPLDWFRLHWSVPSGPTQRSSPWLAFYLLAGNGQYALQSSARISSLNFRLPWVFNRSPIKKWRWFLLHGHGLGAEARRGCFLRAERPVSSPYTVNQRLEVLGRGAAAATHHVHAVFLYISVNAWAKAGAPRGGRRPGHRH